MNESTRQKLRQVANRTPRKPSGQFAKDDDGQAQPAAPPQAEPPVKPPTETEVYYDAGRGGFWVQNAGGEWQCLNKDNLGLVLRRNWFRQFEKDLTGLNQVESKILDAIQNHSVHWAGRLAGWKPGLREICGERVLITRGPKEIVPRRGKWPLLQRFLNELLGKEAIYFYAWMKWAYKSLSEGAPFLPGQLLVVAGKVRCGKSLLQQLITVMLGGRVADPYRYMTALTSFNGDLIESEHLMLEDKESKTDIRSRRAFGKEIKAFVVNKQQSAHPKGRQAVTVEPFWRLTMSLNDEPEQLMVLPPMTPDVSDKIILLKASQATFPFPSEKFPRQKDFWDALNAEIPCFLYAMGRWEIPAPIADHRFGVAAYHDGDLIHRLNSLSPEVKLWELIVQAGILNTSTGLWSGTASELETALKDKSNARQVDELLYYNTACSVYLSRLARAMPENFEREDVGKNPTIWHIGKDKE